MKCDLHVHSYFSGPCQTPIVGSFCRESYTDPAEIYSHMARKGMGLVTLTDHDSIEGSEQLRRHPNFFVSEELTCRMPSGTVAHIGVYDLTDRQHAQLQQRRNDLVALLVYLSERRLFFSVNHVFSGLTGRRELEDFDWFKEYFPALESRNSHLLESANTHAALLAKRWNKISIGGSDAHALRSAGTVYTEVPGARDKEEFFAGLRNGKGRVAGESGSCWKLTRDILVIAGEMMREKNWTALLAPLAVLLPLASMLNYYNDYAFDRKWAALIFQDSPAPKLSSWLPLPQPAEEKTAWP